MKAPRLSSAQRRALLELPVHRDFIPEHTGFQWPTLACLKAQRLINGVRDGLAGMGPKAKHRLTPRGLRVRQDLLSAAEPPHPALSPAGRG